MSPACGPPTSLSPLNVTRSAPAASRSRGVGSWARPKAAVSSSAPLPRSSMTIAPCAMGEAGELGRRRAPRRTRPARSSRGGRGARPSPGRRRGAPRSRPRGSGSSSRPRPAARRSAGRSRGSARHRRSRPARLARPRPRRPPASPTASATAAALLSVTSASSAPVSAMRCVLGGPEARGPRRPASRSNSSSE